jgi:hypothetical protein
MRRYTGNESSPESVRYELRKAIDALNTASSQQIMILPLLITM